MSLAAHGASAWELLHSEGGTEAIYVLSLLFPARWQGRDVSASSCLWACGIPGCSPRQGGAAWQLLSLASFLRSLSEALEGSLASNELSKLWMTARHTKQLLLPAPLGGWLPTPNSCGIPTPWCLHGGTAGSTGGRGTEVPRSASLPLSALRCGSERAVSGMRSAAKSFA